jgi:hypothetical protein
MPRTREGFGQLTTLVPVDVLQAIGELAGANGRSRAEEVVHALERHLAAPPVVRVETPPLPPLEMPPPTKRPRGRPRKPHGAG